MPTNAFVMGGGTNHGAYSDECAIAQSGSRRALAWITKCARTWHHNGQCVMRKQTIYWSKQGYQVYFNPPPPRLHLHRPVYFYSTWMASDEISPTIQHMSFRLGILNIKTGANLTSLVNGRREQPEIKAIRLGLLFAEVKTKRRHGSLYTCTAWWKCRGVHPPPPTVRPTVSEWT